MRSFETKGMKKKLTLQKLVFFPFVLMLAVSLVFLYGMFFDPAHAAETAGGFGGWLRHNIAPVMFVSMVGLLIMGYPTAFTLAGIGMIFGLIGIELGELTSDLFKLMPDRVYGVMSNETLLAIPFFTFMGLILERSGMAEDLLDTIGHLFGTARGGLAYAVIFVGALLAATTGVVAASVIAMGLISLPIMMRYGYDRSLASGVIAASGTLAQIIPPSLVLIIMADQLGRSVGDMYMAAFIPGLLLAAMYAGWIFILTIIKPHFAPGLPVDAIAYREPDGRRGLISLLVLFALSFTVAYFMLATKTLKSIEFVVFLLFTGIMIAFAVAVVNWISVKLFNFKFLSTMAQQVTFVMVPPLFLIFLVLGTIFIGLATPTEGGAMGAIGALLLAWAKRAMSGETSRFNLPMIQDAVLRTAKLSSFVLFILVGARVFSLTFYGVSGHHWVAGLLTSVTGNPTTFLIFVSILIFLLAFFLDFFELAFIAVPLIAPAAEALGIDLIWLGVILSVNMQTSFMHPPFGFALIYLRSVAPNAPYIDKVTGIKTAPITTGQIYWGAVPYVIIQLIMVLMVILFPQMVMHYKKGAIVVDQATIDKQLDSFGTTNDLNLELPEF